MNSRWLIAGILVLLVVLAATHYLITKSTADTAAQSGAAQGAQQKALPGYGADSAAINDAMIGLWRSNEDEKFTREFKADGTVIDRYGTDATATSIGNWSLFTAGNIDTQYTGQVASDSTYLKIMDADTPYFYIVVKAMGSDLQLMYLDRGNMLTFTRVR